MNQNTVELVTYQLKDNVTEQQLAATHEGVHSFLRAQPGFLYRSLSRDETGQCFDIVYWQDMAAAKAAGEAFMADPAGLALIDLTEMESVVMRHMDTLTQQAGDCQAS